MTALSVPSTTVSPIMNAFSGLTVFRNILIVGLATYLSITARFSSFSLKSNLMSVAAVGSSGSGPYGMSLIVFAGRNGRLRYGVGLSSKSTIDPVFLSLTR